MLCHSFIILQTDASSRIVPYSHLAAFWLTSSLSSASSGCQVVRLLRLSSGTPLVTTLAGSTVTMRKVTTSSRLTTTTDGTFSPHGVKWNRCPVGVVCDVPVDIAQPIAVSVASRLVPYSHLTAFRLTSSLSSASSGCEVVPLH